MIFPCFLSHLATNRRVAASTQRQALNALVFLYRHVLDKPIGDNIAPVKAKKRRRPPVVMTKTEVRQVLNQMKGTHLLMAKVMYGGGLRLMECLRLRVMDLDFAKSQVYVRGKGEKDRTCSRYLGLLVGGGVRLSELHSQSQKKNRSGPPVAEHRGRPQESNSRPRMRSFQFEHLPAAVINGYGSG